MKRIGFEKVRRCHLSVATVAIALPAYLELFLKVYTRCADPINSTDIVAKIPRLVAAAYSPEVYTYALRCYSYL